MFSKTLSNFNASQREKIVDSVWITRPQNEEVKKGAYCATVAAGKRLRKSLLNGVFPLGLLISRIKANC